MSELFVASLTKSCNLYSYYMKKKSEKFSPYCCLCYLKILGYLTNERRAALILKRLQLQHVMLPVLSLLDLRSRITSTCFKEPFFFCFYTNEQYLSNRSASRPSDPVRFRFPSMQSDGWLAEAIFHSWPRRLTSRRRHLGPREGRSEQLWHPVAAASSLFVDCCPWRRSGGEHNGLIGSLRTPPTPPPLGPLSRFTAKWRP